VHNKAKWFDDTGHWIEGDRNGTDPEKRVTGEMIDTFRCSWCGYYMYWKTPFCPNCGSEMEVGKEHEPKNSSM
jgi:rubrerythrin